MDVDFLGSVATIDEEVSCLPELVVKSAHRVLYAVWPIVVATLPTALYAQAVRLYCRAPMELNIPRCRIRAFVL